MSKAVKYILVAVGIFLGLGVLVTGAFSISYCYKHITAKSYINGESGIHLNAYTSDVFNFSSTSLSFYQNENDEEYLHYQMDLVPAEFNGLENNYQIFFNNEEVIIYSINVGYVDFHHNIKFLNTDNSTLSESELHIRVEFYADKVRLKVSTPIQNSNYIRNYLDVNGFKLEILKKEA